MNTVQEQLMQLLIRLAEYETDKHYWHSLRPEDKAEVLRILELMRNK